MEQQILDLQRQLEMLRVAVAEEVWPLRRKRIYTERRGQKEGQHRDQGSCLLQDAALLRAGGSKRKGVRGRT